ncbi:MAG: D-cysteine desulfhydrase family protein [Actinobacteria bacterium]|nr:D-cysteine desulfhydrase family protein [Actinomycetota bacterium]
MYERDDRDIAIPNPTVSLLPEPTPLHRLPRLSQELGRELWIKRDDLTAVGVGGNKIRKLEYLLGEADDAEADVLVTVGAVQSNHCRAVASVASITGRDCHLVFAGAQPSTATGNLLLDDYLGATCEYLSDAGWAEIFDAAEAACVRLREQGRRPYLMPAGGSTATGALGYANAYGEFREQCAANGLEPAAIVHANGSGGTQAGLIVGRELLGGDTHIIGVAVSLDAELMAAVSDGLADVLLRELGAEVGLRQPATVLSGYRGSEYGVETPAGREALRLMLAREGILLDPVYSAKAFAAVVAGDPALPDGPIVFWHTGGTPAVFATEGGE